MQELKKLTAAEICALFSGRRRASMPRADYSAVKEFPRSLTFAAGCCFSADTLFGRYTIFGAGCLFGRGCRFMECCLGLLKLRPRPKTLKYKSTGGPK